MLRKINTIYLLPALVCGLAVVGTAAAAEPGDVPDVQTIVTKANVVAYYQGDDGKAKVKMTITDKRGQKRQREFIILRQDVADGGDQNYFVYFQRPADVRRMTYMVRKHAAIDKDDDRWLYMPSIDRLNRIAAGDKRTSFVGSDFLYEDVSGRSLDEDTHELASTTDTAFVVKNTPKKPDSVEFSYFTVAIDRQNYVPTKMEFFDKEGKLYRTIESQKVELIQELPTVTKSVVQDLKTGSKTEMEFTDVQYNIKLKNVFEERYLRRPPREAMR